MNTWDSPDGEPTLADIEREFPGWMCERGSGWCYARRRDTPQNQYDARGENPLDLRDAIRFVLSRDEEAAWQATQSEPEHVAQGGG